LVILPNRRVASITPEFDLNLKFKPIAPVEPNGVEDFCPLLGIVVVVARCSSKDDYGLCSVERSSF
jgi:hypothetical protein